MATLLTRTSSYFPTVADVKFRSRDGVILNIHYKNLELNSGCFPPEDFTNHGEVVHLTENASTLEFLFQFIYPRCHPDLESIDFHDLALLAEASEKYKVYAAMNMCKVRMRSILPLHGPEILGYAAKHGYSDIIEEAAPLTLCIPLAEVVTLLPHELIVPWIRYHEEWMNCLNDAFIIKLSRHVRYEVVGRTVWAVECDSWKNRWPQVLLTLQRGVSNFQAAPLDTIFKPEDGSRECCKAALRSWRRELEHEIQNIMTFSNFL